MQTILVQTCTCSWWISRQHNGSLIPWSRIFIAACYSQMCFSSGHQDSSSPGWNWKTQVSWILRQIWAPNTRPILDTLPDFFLKKSWLDLACILKVLKYPCTVSPENVNSNQLAKPHGIPMGHVHSPLTILINILHTPVVRELFPILHPSQNWGIPCTAIGCPIVWKGITWKVRLSWMITWGETQAINKEKMSNPVDLNAVISIIYTILSY